MVKIGKGAFGSVEQVYHKKKGEFYAIKKLPYKLLQEKSIADNEVKMMQKIEQLNCLNVVKFKQSYIHEDNIFLVL